VLADYPIENRPNNQHNMQDSIVPVLLQLLYQQQQCMQIKHIPLTPFLISRWDVRTVSAIMQ
jgi:hypothetical protein